MHTHKTHNKHVKDQDKKMLKQNKMIQKVYKIPTEFALCWSTAQGHGACPEVWLICPVGLHWTERIFLGQ